jgi:hypothetical protein
MLKGILQGKEMLIRSINNWLNKIKFNFINLKKLKLRD